MVEAGPTVEAEMTMLPRKTILLPEARYLDFKRSVAECSWFFEADRSLFVLALGANRSATFDAIALNPELEIIWRGSFLPWWASPLGLISAAYGGIVKVKGLVGLRLVCDNLLPQAAMELLVVTKESEDPIAGKLRALGRKASVLQLAEKQADGILAVVFMDDDASGDYPIIHRQHDAVLCPLLRDLEVN